MSVTSNVMVNGDYVPQRMTIEHILNQNRKDDIEDDFKVDKKSSTHPGVGLLSRTLIRSPMVKWILPARIRGSKLDLIFVSENSIHIKSVQKHGILEDVGTRADFPSQIRSAAILGEPIESSLAGPNNPASSTSTDSRTSRPGEPALLPSQILVVALASAELRFLVVDNKTSSGSSLRFHESYVPLPVDPYAPRTPGKHLVVDPLSRAIALAASRDTIVLYGLKDRETIGKEYTADQRTWNPIEHERVLKVDGPILAMDFINPGAPEADRVVLVVIVAVRSKAKLGVYEWTVAGGPATFRRIVENFGFSSGGVFCNLIIPMEHSPTFLVVHGTDVTLCDEVLAGSPKLSSFIQKHDDDPQFPASSKRLPVYTSWKRCHRNSNWKSLREEALHLVREDGVVNYITKNDDTPGERARAARFNCHISTAFTNFSPNLAEPDYLITTGDLSPGQVLVIGGETHEKNRRDAMVPQHRESLPNWSPIMDLEIAQPERRRGVSSSNRPSIYTTSGRQPYGAITELRVGCEAKLNLEVESSAYDYMTGAHGVWALSAGPDDPVDGMTIFISYPEATTTWHILADQSQIFTVDIGADNQQSTLFATRTWDGLSFQVTERSLRLMRPYTGDAEDQTPTFAYDLPTGDTIVAADSVCSGRKSWPFVLLAIRSNNQVTLQLRQIPGSDSQIIGEPFPLNTDLTCLSLISTRDDEDLLAIAGLRNGTLHVFSADTNSGLVFLSSHSMGPIISTQSQPIGESIVTVHNRSDASSDANDYLVMCGLRDGNLYTVKLGVIEHEGSITIAWGRVNIINMGTSPVKLFRVEEPKRVTEELLEVDPDIEKETPPHSVAYAVCGPDICSISYRGRKVSAPSITSIWYTDIPNPEYPQPHISSLSITSFKDGNCNFITVDGSILRFASLGNKEHVVPRQIPLKRGTSSPDPEEAYSESPGTPQRLLYSQRLNTMIVANTKCELVPPPDPSTRHPPKILWEGKRTNRAILQFIPMAYTGEDPGEQDACVTIPLNRGERVRSVIEWECRTEDGTHYFILVGTHLVNKDGRKTGQLWFFDPRVATDGSLKVVLRFVKAVDSPVRALAVYDDAGVVISGNNSLSLYGFVMEAGRSKWRKICTSPLLSQATYITVHKPMIYITTSSDSMQAFELKPHHHGTQPVNSTASSPITYTLEHVFNHGTARSAVVHFPLSLPNNALSPTQSTPKDGDVVNDDKPGMILVADKHGDVTGLLHPRHRTHQTAADTLFELQLPQCVTRFSRGAIRAPWRVNTEGVKGVIADDIIGSCTDGTVYAFTVLNGPAIAFLKYLEGIVGTNGLGRPEFDVEEGRVGYRRYAVNGDFLARLVEPRGGPVTAEEALEGLVVVGEASRAKSEKVFRTLLGRVLERDLGGEAFGNVVAVGLEWLGQVLQSML